MYILARPTSPALLQSALVFVNVDAQPQMLFSLPFVFQLPSFFHMLALMLMTAAISAKSQRPVTLAITGVSVLAMEFVQHPAVTKIMGECVSSNCSWLTALTDYAQAGTFDPLDVYAIVLAAIVAVVIIMLIPTVTDHKLQTRT